VSPGGVRRILNHLETDAHDSKRLDYRLGAFSFSTDVAFWKERFLPLLRAQHPRANITPLEKSWAVVADLFDPARSDWGLRGDLFLWLEMRHMLGHVPVPDDADSLTPTIIDAFAALVGSRPDPGRNYSVKRFARGGMSSGMVCGEFWMTKMIPMLQKRLTWLQRSWERWEGPGGQG
jgi:hypothetical protein